MKKTLLIAIIFINLSGIITAQVSFRASANKVVAAGERFRINFNLNANGSNFRAPDLSNFRILAGPMSSTSTSIKMINGKTTQSISNTYSYVVQASTEGKFTIGSAQITVSGKLYKSNPITIEVLKGNSQPTNSNPGSGKNRVSSSSKGNVFVRINLSKTKVYQGEQIIASLKIYDKTAQLGGFNDIKFPSYSGFWAQEVKTPTNLSLTRDKYNNEIYYSAVLRQDVLFPQKSGTLTIDPCTVDCIVKEKVGQRRNFFGEPVDVYQNAQRVLKSPTRKVRVLPLPANKPASFTGAVGSNFKFNMNVDRTELKSNESISLKLTVSGNGNMKIVDKINIDFPASFDVFDPKISNNINSSASGSRGSKTFEYLIIPREPGEYKIPATQFSYFDVKSATYKTLTTKEINFKIEQGEKTSLVTSQGAINQEMVQNSGSDIRHIITDKFQITKGYTNFFGSTLFYLLYLISAVLFVIAMIITGKKIKRNKNIVLQKNRKANKISRKRLKEAAKYMKENNKESFYNEVIKALWGFLSDKLNIPVSELSRETVSETLENKQVNDDIIKQFIEIIDNCEFAKYAPASGENQMSEDYDKARIIINKLIETL